MTSAALRMQASRTGDELLGRIRGFDPYAAMQRATDAAVGSLFEQYGEQFRDLRGGQVGTGRLNTGFGGMDEARLTNLFADRVGNVVAQNALQAAGLDLTNIGNLGSMYGQQLDLATSERELEIAREIALRQERMNRRRGIGSVFGSLLGAGIGALIPGVGTAIGAGIGAGIGSGIGSGVGSLFGGR